MNPLARWQSPFKVAAFGSSAIPIDNCSNVQAQESSAKHLYSSWFRLDGFMSTYSKFMIPSAAFCESYRTEKIGVLEEVSYSFNTYFFTPLRFKALNLNFQNFTADLLMVSEIYRRPLLVNLRPVKMVEPAMSTNTMSSASPRRTTFSFK